MAKERKAILEKKKKVEELMNNIKGKKDIMIIDLRNTPDKLLQSSRKKLKEKYKAYIKAGKLTVIKRALKGINAPELLYNDIEFPVAVVGLDEHPYTIAKFFSSNMLSVAAKPGQEAPEDIVVPAGETDIPPGPALSELKAAGINVKIEKGKIVVAKDSVVAKKGEVLTEQKVKALQTLGIKPFKVGVKIYKAYYNDIVFPGDVLLLKPSELEESIENAALYGFNLAFNSGYPTPETVELIIREAARKAVNLAFNSNIYSPLTIEYIITKAINQARAVESEVKSKAPQQASETSESSNESPKEGSSEEENAGKTETDKKEDGQNNEGNAQEGG